VTTASKASPKKPQTKTSYVLGFPHSTPAKEVVAKGKAAGVALTDKLVWAIRSDEKKKKGLKKSHVAHGASKHAAHGATARSNGMRVSAKVAEDVLRAAAHVLGLARASEILDAEQRRAHALLT
jgi:hypothetical protein